MAIPTTRQLFVDYCLRTLGEPVVEINIDDSQIEDRVDEAIEYWRQYHYDGIERVYLKQKVTASTMNLASPVSGYSQETVSGETSGGGAAAESPITLTSGFSYDIIIGAGGQGANNGSNSSFNNIVSIGGGYGGYYNGSFLNGIAGGSGGGAAVSSSAGSGTSG